MDIFTERDYLSRQEGDFDANSIFANKNIPLTENIPKVFILHVGDTVWLKGVGPRTISSVCFENFNSKPRYVTLAEEYGRFPLRDISPYRVIEHLEFIDNIKSLEWDFIARYGLPLLAIPIGITLSAFFVTLCAEVLLFYRADIESWVVFVLSAFLLSMVITGMYKIIERFIKKVYRIRVKKEVESNLRNARGERVVVPHFIREAIDNANNEEDEEEVW